VSCLSLGSLNLVQLLLKPEQALDVGLALLNQRSGRRSRWRGLPLLVYNESLHGDTPLQVRRPSVTIKHYDDPIPRNWMRGSNRSLKPVEKP
jgi:hypothetical protein